MDKQNQHLLSDEQVRRFIADGFVIIDSKLSSDFHQRVSQQIAYALEYELPHPGDNIVPRVPLLNRLSNSAAVQGALTSVLGEGVEFLPHRFPHNSNPLKSYLASASHSGENNAEERTEGEFLSNDRSKMKVFATQPKMARGSISASAWHQDSHATCGRTRWHRPRAANVFYFPHATSLEMGPTRFLAGSHMYATLHDIRAEQVVMQEIPEGSVVIAHFDLIHAGSPNTSNKARYMMKFVALRCENPTKPSWNNKEIEWRTPEKLKTHHDLPDAWQSIWHWMRGGLEYSIPTNPISRHNLKALIAGIKSPDQQERLSSLYKLVTVGAPAVEPLVAELLTTAKKSPREENAYGSPEDVNSRHLDRFFLDAQFTPEDSAVALSAIGEPGVTALVKLLGHTDPWIRINAVFALGDAGSAKVGENIGQMEKLLDDPEPHVILATLDALAALGIFGEKAISQMKRFLNGVVTHWGTDAKNDPRLAELGKMRYLSAIALLSWLRSSAKKIPHLVSFAEAALLESLNDESGYPALIACSALERSDSVENLRAALIYLRGRSWDAAQNTRQIGQWTLDHNRATLERISTRDQINDKKRT